MSKQGSSLIETMVAMVLLIIIALSSAYFFAIPPFRKEALRFAALERAAGMLDLMSYWRQYAGGVDIQYYEVTDYPNINVTGKGSDDQLRDMPFYKNASEKMASMAYTLRVSDVYLVAPSNQLVREAVIKLYDKQSDTNSSFATFKMILPPGS